MSPFHLRGCNNKVRLKGWNNILHLRGCKRKIITKITKNSQQTRNNPWQTRYNLWSNSCLPTHPHQSLQRLHTQTIFRENQALHRYNVNGGKDTMSFLLKRDNSTRWYEGLSNEWGRIWQGNDHGIKCTDTLVYIQSQEVQKDRKVTDGSFYVTTYP